jgi:4-amino-4-deoxy-L-arabinose transferase-like glycosyltransferase
LKSRLFEPIARKAALLVLGLGLGWMTLARLSVIYETYSPTYDEPYHIASGMEWLDQSRYQYEKFHPPLARVFLAIGPYWSGARASMLRRSVDEGNQILLWKAGWLDTLTLARMGNLPFLALASVSVFLWGRRWFSTATGVWGVVMLLSLPPILGHGGLATLDLACAATLIGALYASMRWAEDQSWATALAMGFTTGVALLSKYSNTGFLAVCWLVEFASG